MRVSDHDLAVLVRKSNADKFVDVLRPKTQDAIARFDVVRIEQNTGRSHSDALYAHTARGECRTKGLYLETEPIHDYLEVSMQFPILESIKSSENRQPLRSMYLPKEMYKVGRCEIHQPLDGVIGDARTIAGENHPLRDQPNYEITGLEVKFLPDQ